MSFLFRPRDKCIRALAEYIKDACIFDLPLNAALVLIATSHKLRGNVPRIPWCHENDSVGACDVVPLPPLLLALRYTAHGMICPPIFAVSVVEPRCFPVYQVPPCSCHTQWRSRSSFIVQLTSPAASGGSVVTLTVTCSPGPTVR